MKKSENQKENERKKNIKTSGCNSIYDRHFKQVDLINEI